MSAANVPVASPSPSPARLWVQRQGRSLRRQMRRKAVATRRLWYRSLGFRVVSLTLALGIGVLLLVGSVVLQQVSDSLVSSARSNAQRDAQQQIENTITSFQAQKFNNEQEVRVWVRQRMNDLHGPAETPLRYVVLLKDKGTNPGALTDQGLGVNPQDIPDPLRQEVIAHNQKLVTQVVTVEIRNGGGTLEVPCMLVGSHVNLGPLGAGFGDAGNGWYELYLIYPLQREVDLLGDIQRTFAGAAAGLLLLIALVAALVSRQVVDPVRQAAHTAEELASGRFDRRIPVRGTDDLARLGRAFNDMAVSLEHKITELEELSTVQRRFVSDVSHELRTPLTTIQMAGAVLYEGRGDLEPALARTAELLHTQLERFELLLTDLLEISRFDAGAASLELDQVAVTDAVQTVIDGLQPLAERRGSPLMLHVDAEDTLAHIDARRVARVVRNLVGNAIEHGEGQPIDIRIAADDQVVSVGVRDYGVGLTSEDAAQVFNRFWRADESRARRTGGTGLGLAIAQEDAHLHDGWLRVWGLPGLGANFVLTLPRVPGQPVDHSAIDLVALPDPDPDPESDPESDADVPGTASDSDATRSPTPSESA